MMSEDKCNVFVYGDIMLWVLIRSALVSYRRNKKSQRLIILLMGLSDPSTDYKTSRVDCKTVTSQMVVFPNT